MSAESQETLLRIEGLFAGHGGLAVVRDLDLEVRSGRVVALLGPNGAGKTTVLETVAGLLPSLQGTIDLLGQAPNVKRPHLAPRRGLAFVPDNRCLFQSLTTRQNLTLAARRHRVPLDLVFGYMPELVELQDRPAGLLSGGQQQMLAIGRALLMKPRLLMIDELSMGLAPIIVERLLHVVRNAADDLNLGVLLVEQHVRLALDVADDAYVISHGVVTASGHARDVAAQVAEIEASYLGQAHEAAPATDTAEKPDLSVATQGA
ncbi:ABC transporter ATP-binding protein [Dactylosporangium sp. NPDC051485]|uniref:ABC transporter ATP-binding protein n=1 Tax=Dactylosporangium sp. NPDC051485 TaxID=3154846 RepID=UPI00342421E6